MLPVPRDDKGRVLIQGRYQSNDALQMLSPREVIDQLLETVFAVQRYVLVAMLMVAVATGAVVLLVFLLSWRARQSEQMTLLRLGGSRFAISSLMLAEALAVTLLALLLAAILTALTVAFGGPLLQAFVL